MSKIRMLRKEAQVALPNSGETYTAEDGTVSMVLDDEHNDQYEPTDQEIKEYAEWLGMELPADEELLWIAKEGLKAPLPKEWKPCKTDTAEVYYFNFKTGDSIWDHPMDDHFKRKFKTEKERLAKRKLGVEEESALSKLPQRSNVIFTESGVMRSDDTDSNGSTGGAKPSTQATKGPTLKTNTSFSSVTSNPGGAAAEASKSAATSKFGVTTTKSTGSKPATSRTVAPITSNSLGDSIPLPDSPDEMTLDSTPTAHALKRKKEAVTEAPVIPTPITSPVEVRPVAKISSEAEKALEAKVRKELQAKLEEDLAVVKREVQTRIQVMANKFREASATARADHEGAIKRAGRKIDNELDDELAAKQRALEASSRSSITALQSEVDELRESLKTLNSRIAAAGASSSSDISNVVAEARRASNAVVEKKVAAIEEEVDEIRERHRKKQKELITKAESSLEEAVEEASAAAIRASRAELADRLDTLKASHQAEIKRLNEQADREMEDERRRTERSAQDQSSTLVAEVRVRQEEQISAVTSETDAEIAAITKRTSEELEALAASHQAALAQERSKQLVEDSSDRFSEAERRASSQRDAFVSTLQQKKAEELAAANERRLTALANARQLTESSFPELVLSSTGANDVEDAVADVHQRAREERVQRESALHDRYSKQVSELEQRIKAMEESNTSAAAGKSKLAAEHALHAALNAFIREETERRAVAEREYQDKKRDVLARIEASRSAPAAGSPTRRPNPETPKRDAAMRARQEVEDRFHAKANALRNTCRDQKAAQSIQLADTLAADERNKRRSIDAAVNASVDAWRRAATKSMTAEVDDMLKLEFKADSMGGTSCGDPSSDSGITEEEDLSSPPESDDEAAVLATAHLPPVPNVAYEVQRRLKGIMLEYEQREAALRASMRGQHIDPQSSR